MEVFQGRPQHHQSYDDKHLIYRILLESSNIPIVFTLAFAKVGGGLLFYVFMKELLECLYFYNL